MKILFSVLIFLFLPALIFGQTKIRVSQIEDIQGTYIKSLGEAANKVLTTNGTGGATWQIPATWQTPLNGTGFVKMTGTTVSYDPTTYLPLSGGTLTGNLTVTGGSISTNGTIRSSSTSGWTIGSLTNNPRIQYNSSGTGMFSAYNGANTLSNLQALRVESTIPTGNSPFVVSSTTVTTNLNADLLDGLHGSGYIQNQNLSAQAANMWINGSGKFGSTVNATKLILSGVLGNMLDFQFSTNPAITLYQNATLWGFYNNTNVRNILTFNNTTDAATFVSNITAPQFTSNITTGVSPLVVASTTLNTNLNADLLDGQHGSYYAAGSGSGNYIQNQFSSGQTADWYLDGQTRSSKTFSTAGATSSIGYQVDVTESLGNSNSQLKGIQSYATHSGSISPLIVSGGDFRAYLGGTSNAQNLVGSSSRVYLSGSGTATTIAYSNTNLLENTSSANMPWLIGLSINNNHKGTGAITEMRGLYNDVNITSTGGVSSTAVIYNGHMNNTGGATIAAAEGIYVKLNNTAGTMTKAHAGTFDIANTGTGIMGEAVGVTIGEWTLTNPPTTTYGLKIDSTIDLGLTRYSIYSQSTSPSYHRGTVLIGTNINNGEDKLQVSGTISGFPAEETYQMPTYGQVASMINNTAGNYIKNQNLSAQTANMWINGAGIFEGNLTTYGNFDLTNNALLRAGQIQSGVATGTAPFTLLSTTLNTNLNADLLDGQHGSYYSPATGSANYIQSQNAAAQTANMWITGTIKSNGTIHSNSTNGWAIGSLVDVARIDYTSNQFRALNAANGYTGFKGTSFESTNVATAPFVVASSQLVTNLNADLFDGYNSTQLPFIHSPDASAGITSGIIPAASRSTNPTPNAYSRSLSVEFKNGGDIGLPYSGYAGLMTFASYNGVSAGGAGYQLQLAYNAATNNPNSDVFSRTGTDATWGTWNKFLTTGNFVAGTNFATPNQTMNIGTTPVAINRASAAQALTGITSIDGSAAKLTTARTINNVSFDGSANIVVPTIYDAAFKSIINPGGALLTGAIPTVTGAIQITLPVGFIGSMMRMTIKVYEYQTNESFDVNCGGYTYSGGNTWGNSPFAYIVGNPGVDRRLTVRFGNTAAGKACIYIGELASTWSYPQIFVTDAQFGFSGVSSSYLTGWTVGFQPTAFENVTATITDTQVGYASSSNIANSVVKRDASGNFAAGSIIASAIRMTTGAFSGYALISDVSGNGVWTALSIPTQTSQLTNNSSFITEAPTNANYYVRNNAGWSILPEGQDVFVNGAYLAFPDFTDSGSISFVNTTAQTITANLNTIGTITPGDYTNPNIRVGSDGRVTLISNGSAGGSMVYPGVGIALSSGSGWSGSIANNSGSWNTAYSERANWDGGTSGLVAANGRTSLGGTTIGQSMFTFANPGAIMFPRFNANNTVSALYPSELRTAIGAGTPTTLDVGQRSATLMGITSDGSTNDLFIPNFETTSVNSGMVTGSNNLGATYYLNGSGAWSIPAGGGTPGGSATQVQYSNGSAFAGSASFTFASVSGIVTATNFQLGSDRRLKRSIQPIGNVQWIDDIHFKSFYMKSDSTGTLRYGVIAQEVEKINPNLVSTSQETGMKAVSYTDLLIAKVARQDEIINDLIKRLEKLENEK